MTTILVTLIVYKLALLGIGLFAQRRTKSKEDMYLGGRSLGPVVAAISAAASSSSVWTLLGVSGMAFKTGLAALWLFPACVGGFALNWFVIAPRLRRHSAHEDSLTLTDVLAGPDRTAPGRHRVVVLASIITLFCLMTYVASQLNGAGTSFETVLDMNGTAAILLGTAIIIVYTMLGGFWAVSLTDTLQGLMMAGVSIFLPIAALAHVGWFGGLFDKLETVSRAQDSYFSPGAGLDGVFPVLFVIGFLGITFGYPGQPHVVNRFMALGNDRDVAVARRIAMLWAVLVYAGMLLLGLCARAELYVELPTEYNPDAAFFEMAQRLFPEVLYGVILAAVLSAIMSTADSQLLVSASTVSHDLGFAHDNTSKQIARDRIVIFLLSAAAALAAIFGEKGVFDKVLFAWSGAGAAFGPLLFWMLFVGPVPNRVKFTTMLAAFTTCIVSYAGSNKWLGFWNLYGFERNFLPYFAAILVLVLFARRTR